MSGGKASASEVTALAAEVSVDALSTPSARITDVQFFEAEGVSPAAFQALVARVASLETQVTDLRSAKGSAQ